MISSLSLDSEGPITVEERRLSIKWDRLEDLYSRRKECAICHKVNLPSEVQVRLEIEIALKMVFLSNCGLVQETKGLICRPDDRERGQ